MKILITPCVAIFEYIYRSKALRNRYYACIGVICFGVFLSTVHGGIELNFFGTVIGFATMAVSALYQIFIDKKQKELGCTSAQLLYYQSPLAAAMLFAILPYTEPVTKIFTTHWSFSTIIFLILSCVLSFFVNISMFLAIGKASPITYNVFSQVKTVSNYIVAIVVFHEPTTFGNISGMLLTVSGIVAWSVFKMRESSADTVNQPTKRTKTIVGVSSFIGILLLFLMISSKSGSSLEKKHSIVVAGGAGYIGSHVTKALLIDPKYEDYNIVVIDNLSTGHRASLPKDGKRFKFVHGDVSDMQTLDKLFTKHAPNTAGVIHLCAASLVAESVANPLKYYDANIAATSTLVQGMLKHKVNNMLFSSTAAIFGIPKTMPIFEDTEKLPTNPYGETKLAIEKMLDWTSKANPQFKWVALRYFNAAGADSESGIGEAHDPETHLIPNILKVPLGTSKSVNIFGFDYETRDGTNVRDYIHVTDLSDAHLRALNYLIAGGSSDVFNLGNGSGFSNNEVVEACRRVTGHPIPVTKSPRRPGDPPTLIADSTKARTVLGWNPTRNIDVIVQDAWNWHSKNPNLYKK